MSLRCTVRVIPSQKLKNCNSLSLGLIKICLKSNRTMLPQECITASDWSEQFKSLPSADQRLILLRIKAVIHSQMNMLETLKSPALLLLDYIDQNGIIMHSFQKLPNSQISAILSATREVLLEDYLTEKYTPNCREEITESRLTHIYNGDIEENNDESHEARNKAFELLYHPITKTIICVLLLGVPLWLLPPPLGLTVESMRVLSVFLTIVSLLIITDIPIAIIVAVGMMVLVLSSNLYCKTKSYEFVPCNQCSAEIGCKKFSGAFDVAMSGFSDQVAWLIFSAFHIGTAIKVTNLGTRAALILLKILGKSLIGVGFAVFLAELIIGPFIPSNTARGGGVILPIAMSLIQTIGSTPTKEQNVGKYIIMCSSHSNLLISSLFVTACAPNPIILSTAKKSFDSSNCSS